MTFYHLRSALRLFRLWLPLFGGSSHSLSMTGTPNKSPEPAAVGAGSSAVAVHAASRRWLSFFSLGRFDI